ncbi:C39 family peptidase [Methanosarcina sp. T3]|uniref:C39 family peptidase n=1 Tax=Methanosarcina sp. T3 TaxID=3439062 RepID=UPI003F8485F0
MVKNKITISILLLTMLVGMALIPAASAQEEKDYSVTAEEAFKHANANMISFIAADAPGFENWTGASIDSKPLELYDINGKKLFYRFSVYKENKLIGTIDVCADKTLGPSIYDIVFDPEPYKTAEAMKKSIEIAKSEYSDEKIKSTNLVVYSYPSIGAMTVVKDKATGVEHRIFVDAYSLNEVEDKPATETEPGIWSMYDKILAYGKENNLKEWQKSDELAKSIELAAANKGININAAVTGENIEKLSDEGVVKSSFTGKILDINGIGQEDPNWCGPACIRMVCIYYNKPTPIPTQSSIYYYFPWGDPEPESGLSANDIVEWAEDKWGKTGTIASSFSDSVAISEIENERPFFSMIPGHFRLCKGYIVQSGYTYLRLNDPEPVGSTYGNPGLLERTYGSSEIQRIYVR